MNFEEPTDFLYLLKQRREDGQDNNQESTSCADDDRINREIIQKLCTMLATKPSTRDKGALGCSF